MQTYVVNLDLKRITPIPRHSRLDELMESLGFVPWRPGVPPEDHDKDNRFVQWEYAGNHFLSIDLLKHLVEGRIRVEIKDEVDVTVLPVTIKAARLRRPGPGLDHP
jgi:hypothetical protein